jgi:hypothetical protein
MFGVTGLKCKHKEWLYWQAFHVFYALPDKFHNSISHQATTASLHILSSSNYTKQPHIQLHTIQATENVIK